MCAPICMTEHNMHVSWPRALDSLELELAAKLLPGMKPRSSAGAAHALKSWSVSLQPHKQIFTLKILCFVLYLYSLKRFKYVIQGTRKNYKTLSKKKKIKGAQDHQVLPN